MQWNITIFNSDAIKGKLVRKKGILTATFLSKGTSSFGRPALQSTIFILGTLYLCTLLQETYLGDSIFQHTQQSSSSWLKNALYEKEWT